jgi:hypothetical protein
MGVPQTMTASLAVLFILGCSSGESSAPPPPPPVPPQKTVFDPLTQQLDRARGVQQTVDQNAESTRKAVENQERGDAPQ